MFILMGYNKDSDTYDELVEGNTKQEVLEEANRLLPKLLSDSLRDKSGEPYDWLEIWDDEDENGVDDVIIGGDRNADIL